MKDKALAQALALVLLMVETEEHIARLRSRREAVNFYRKLTDCGLTEAKEYVFSLDNLPQ